MQLYYYTITLKTIPSFKQHHSLVAFNPSFKLIGRRHLFSFDTTSTRRCICFSYTHIYSINYTKQTYKTLFTIVIYLIFFIFNCSATWRQLTMSCCRGCCCGRSVSSSTLIGYTVRVWRYNSQFSLKLTKQRLLLLTDVDTLALIALWLGSDEEGLGGWCCGASLSLSSSGHEFDKVRCVF